MPRLLSGSGWGRYAVFALRDLHRGGVGTGAQQSPKSEVIASRHCPNGRQPLPLTTPSWWPACRADLFHQVRRQSSCKRRQETCVWNEEFDLPLSESVAREVLTVVVFYFQYAPPLPPRVCSMSRWCGGFSAIPVGRHVVFHPGPPGTVFSHCCAGELPDLELALVLETRLSPLVRPSTRSKSGRYCSDLKVLKHLHRLSVTSGCSCSFLSFPPHVRVCACVRVPARVEVATDRFAIRLRRSRILPVALRVAASGACAALKSRDSCGDCCQAHPTARRPAPSIRKTLSSWLLHSPCQWPGHRAVFRG